MVDLTKKPYYLNSDDIEWVEKTIEGMTLDEKIGQLFILLKSVPGADEAYIKNQMESIAPGGMRWQGGSKEEVFKQNRLFQKYSKVPVFVAANCDEGGSGVLKEGTFVASAAEAGASEGTETAYHMGYVSGKEAAAIGVNWMFNPVADLYLNWRNTIVNTRSFGSDADKVIENVRAYIKGIKDAAPNMACTLKHFPGDGCDELDPHISPAHNDLTADAWRKTYGKVYKTMIDEGLETVMIGHISQPALQREYNPGLTDEEIMPATLSKELLWNVLRKELSFNGLIVSDASHMIGLTTLIPRREMVPACIAAGCDMFLFANDYEEDRQYIKDALSDGRISEERLSDALHRILGMKAHLHLNVEENLNPDEKELSVIGCAEHHEYTKAAADAGITLVKDTRQLLPIDVTKKSRAFLVYIASTPNSKAYDGDPVRALVTEELTDAGFEVTQCPNFYDLEAENGVNFMNFIKMLDQGKRTSFKDKFDVVFLVINVKGYAQKNTERVTFSCSHSQEMPWYVEEVPTIGISLNYTNHLIDVVNVHTFINAYGSNQENIHAAIEKIVGRSEFKGTAEETVFCGRWDTRR
jgi:beta-N-acetylhexosaminidase